MGRLAFVTRYLKTSEDVIDFPDPDDGKSDEERANIVGPPIAHFAGANSNNGGRNGDCSGISTSH